MKRRAHHDLRAEDPEDIVAEQPAQKNGRRGKARDADQSDALEVGGKKDKTVASRKGVDAVVIAGKQKNKLVLVSCPLRSVSPARYDAKYTRQPNNRAQGHAAPNTGTIAPCKRSVSGRVVP